MPDFSFARFGHRLGKAGENGSQILTLSCNRNNLREGDKTLEAATLAHQTRCYVAQYMKIQGKK
jgi:hypothetical protein